ncbi:hypothetical protein VUR80DRAFT_9721 [Thermomyces stellatus]
MCPMRRRNTNRPPPPVIHNNRRRCPVLSHLPPRMPPVVPAVVVVLVRGVRTVALGRVVGLAHAAAAGRGAETHAGPDDPDEEEEADDGADNDSGYGAAAEGVGVIGFGGDGHGLLAREDPRGGELDGGRWYRRHVRTLPPTDPSTSNVNMERRLGSRAAGDFGAETVCRRGWGSLPPEVC